MRPSSSGRVLVRTIVSGISVSVIIWCAYTVLPISKLTRRLRVALQSLRLTSEGDDDAPYGYNRGEENQEAEDVDIPEAPEAVQRHQDERQSKGHGAENLAGVRMHSMCMRCWYNPTFASLLISRSRRPTFVSGWLVFMTARVSEPV